jgi:HD-GYP domain-containing protein (c-di-GMP phosphodiesterase class II)
MPMYQNDVFWGFVFFNSLQSRAFGAQRLQILDLYGHLVSALVTGELLQARVLAAAVRTAHDMVHYRDPETGAHIDRIARYARLIARNLGAAGIHPIDDRMVERILEFAPLHDLGKIGMPDRLLLKPGNLSREEREEMKRHTTLGLQMVDRIARNFGLEHLEGLDILRHIAESHHERMDGSGYPRGLRDGAIPIEARIVAVADVFDALTSERPYKRAWPDDEAFGLLRKMARDALDRDCVEALLQSRAEAAEVRQRFRDEPPARA